MVLGAIKRGVVGVHVLKVLFTSAVESPYRAKGRGCDCGHGGRS